MLKNGIGRAKLVRALANSGVQKILENLDQPLFDFPDDLEEGVAVVEAIEGELKALMKLRVAVEMDL